VNTDSFIQSLNVDLVINSLSPYRSCKNTHWLIW